jgi:hypothetical protein
MATEAQIDRLIEAVDYVAETIDNNSNPVDEYYGSASPTHLYNISVWLEDIANTLKKIEAKM